MDIRLRSIALAAGMALTTVLSVFAQTRPPAAAEKDGEGVSGPVSPPTTREAPGPAIEPTTGLDGTRIANVGDAYLAGLIHVDIQPRNLQAQDVLDLENILNDDQIPLLLQALTTNSTATRNAGSITEQLRSRGLLAADEEVVGLRDGKVVKARRASVQDARLRKGSRGPDGKTDPR